MSGWLTPNTPPPDKTFVRRLFIPAQNDWLALVDGALNELTKAYNWQQFGDMTVDDTVAAFDDMYQRYIVNDNEPPDWQNQYDVDGDPAQPWYEALEDWIIAGFLAVTFTPAAAIVYQATVPKLRIAIRTGNIGALFKVLINGVEVWTGDSYSPITDLIDNVIDTSAYTPPYTVRIEHDGIGPNVVGGRAKLEYVRGEVVQQMLQTILRADPTGCGIQWSQDNGGTWDTIDLAQCIGDIATDRIHQAVDNGTIPSGGQLPQSAPATGQCATFHVRLAANSAWPCPIRVNPGDSITLTDIGGAWNDGSGFGAVGPWFCPSGDSYGTGVCGDNDGTPIEGDPSPANHMALIGHVDTWFLGTDGYVVPSGVSNGLLIFQANDSAIADNLGEVTFTVTVCIGAVLNCRVYDFTASENIFVNWGIPGHPEVPGGYASGEGWYGGFARDIYSVGIYTPVTQPGAFNWESVEFEIDSAESGTISTFIGLYDPNSTSSTWIDYTVDITPGTNTYTRAGHFEFPAVGMYWYLHITQNMHLRKISFRGTSVNPTGTGDCA